MKRTIITLAILTLALPAALLADPWDCPGGRGQGMRDGGQGFCGQAGPQCDFDGQGPGRGLGLMMLADELQLTDKQKDQLQTVNTEFQLQQVDRRAELRKAQIQLRNLQRDDNATETTVLTQMDQVGRLRTELHKAQYKHHQAVLSVLTPEQQAKAKELRLQRMQDDNNDDDDTPRGRGMRGRGTGFGG